MEKRKKEIRLQPVIEGETKRGIKIPEIIIYSKENFDGKSLRTNCNIDYIGDCLNDEIYSAVVISGEWQFYKHAGFKEELGKPLKSGYYSDLKNIDPNDEGISSIKCVKF